MQMEGLDSLYQEIVLTTTRNPRNHRLLEEPDLKAEGFNPFCGDRVVLTAKLNDDGLVSEVGFSGEGVRHQPVVRLYDDGGNQGRHRRECQRNGGGFQRDDAGQGVKP